MNMVRVKNWATLLLSMCCVATFVVGRTAPPRTSPTRTPPPREEPPTLDLVDSRPGFSPLYQGKNETLRLKGRYIIKLKETTEIDPHDDLGRLLGKLNDQNIGVSSDAVPVQGLSSYSTVGLGVMADLSDDALDVVRQDKSVDFVEEDQVVSITAEPWHRDRVDQRTLPFNNKYCPPNDGENVDIYILDTGINYCHKDFCNNRARYAGYSPIIAASNSRGADCNGHGTHAAALAVGGIHGIARKARVYSLPVLTCQGRGSFTNIILALNHVVMRANSEPDRRVIVSMSLIGPPSLSVNDAIKTVTQEGIVVITAAGNFLKDACRYTPSSSTDAITVGGTARNDLLYYSSPTVGTNWGRCVDIFAPGQDITSADFRGCTAETECKEMCDRESMMSGTSMATPIVAGAAAILLSADMSLTPVEVKQKLIDQSTKDTINMRDITPSSRSITPNKLVYVGKVRCRGFETCSPPEPEQCGRPWECPPTELYPSVRHNRLSRNMLRRSKTNLVPSFISPYVKGNETHFAIIYKRVDNVNDYQVMFDIDTATAESTVKDMAANNYQVVCATSYYVGDTLYHIIVFSKMRGGADVQVYFEQTGSRNSRNNESAIANGLSLAYRTITINSRGRRRYTTLYRRNNDIQTVEFDNLGFRGLRRMVNQQKKNGFQLVHVSSVTVRSRTRYSAIFTNEKIGDCEYVFYHSLNEKDIADIAESQKQDGFHMTAVAVHSPSSFPLFMAVFRK